MLPGPYRTDVLGKVGHHEINRRTDIAMRLTLLGTGTPTPSVTRHSAANLVDLEGETLLFDAGGGVTNQLARIGRHPREIDHVFITHHHFDHFSGLDELLLSAWNGGRKRPVAVHGPVGTIEIMNALWETVYRRDIAFRLHEATIIGEPMPLIEDVFPSHDLPAGSDVERDGWRVHAGAVEHGHSLGFSHEEWPCLGYRLEAEGRILTISGDTIDCPGVRDLAADADVLVQCCYLPEAAVDTHEKRILVDQVLASSTQAAAIASAAKVKRMVLTHIAAGGDEKENEMFEEASHEHNAEVIIGRDLMEINV